MSKSKLLFSSSLSLSSIGFCECVAIALPGPGPLFERYVLATGCMAATALTVGGICVTGGFAEVPVESTALLPVLKRLPETTDGEGRIAGLARGLGPAAGTAEVGNRDETRGDTRGAASSDKEP